MKVMSYLESRLYSDQLPMNGREHWRAVILQWVYLADSALTQGWSWASLIISHCGIGVGWSGRTHHHFDILTVPSQELILSKHQTDALMGILSKPANTPQRCQSWKKRRDWGISLPKETQPVEMVWYPGQDNGHSLSHIQSQSSCIKPRY